MLLQREDSLDKLFRERTFGGREFLVIPLEGELVSPSIVSRFVSIHLFGIGCAQNCDLVDWAERGDADGHLD